jgi:hypothetical protein
VEIATLDSARASGKLRAVGCKSGICTQQMSVKQDREARVLPRPAAVMVSFKTEARGPVRLSICRNVKLTIGLIRGMTSGAGVDQLPYRTYSSYFVR